jgi:hypothetical protein
MGAFRDKAPGALGVARRLVLAPDVRVSGLVSPFIAAART